MPILNSPIYNALAPARPKRHNPKTVESDPVPRELENISNSEETFSADFVVHFTSYALRCRDSRSFLRFVHHKFPEVKSLYKDFRFQAMNDTSSYSTTMSCFCRFFRLNFEIKDNVIFNLCPLEFEIFKKMMNGVSLDSIAASLTCISQRLQHFRRTFLLSLIDSINEKLLKTSRLDRACGFSPAQLRIFSIICCYNSKRTYSIRHYTLVDHLYRLGSKKKFFVFHGKSGGQKKEVL